MIITNLKADNLAARKAKDKVTSGILTTLIGEILMVGKNDGNRETTNEEAIKVITKFKKGVLESISILEKSKGKMTWGDKSKFDGYDDELRIYERYLPKLMTEDELKEVITQIINSGASKIGPIMGELNKNYKGEFDGKLASTIIREVLNG